MTSRPSSTIMPGYEAGPRHHCQNRSIFKVNLSTRIENSNELCVCIFVKYKSSQLVM